MSISNLFISVTEGPRKLIIDGPLDLFQKFITTMIDRPEAPDPNLEPITPPKGAIS